MKKPCTSGENTRSAISRGSRHSKRNPAEEPPLGGGSPGFAISMGSGWLQKSFVPSRIATRRGRNSAI
jgi:hypothetical protein